MKIIPSILVLVFCFAATRGLPALNREVEDSDEVIVPLDVEPRIIPGRWAPFGFNVNFSPWYSPFTSGIGDILKHLTKQVGGAMGSNNTNITSKTEVIDGMKVTVNESMFFNKETGTAYHMKVVDVQPTSNSEESDEQLLMEENGDSSSEEATEEDSSRDGDDRMEDWVRAVEGLLNTGKKDGSSTSEPQQSGESGERSKDPVVVDNSSGMMQRKKDVAATTEMKHEATESTEADQENEIRHKEEDTETYRIPHNDQVDKILETREYLPRSYEDDVNNNEVDVFDTYKPINMERDTLVNQLMSDQQHKSGLVMIDPDAELFDVKDGAIVKTYYNPHHRFQKIIT